MRTARRRDPLAKRAPAAIEAIPESPATAELFRTAGAAAEFASVSASPLTRSKVALPWWIGRTRHLREMEAGLAAAGIRRMSANEISDQPTLHAIQETHRLWAARGYRFLAEGPFGRLRLMILLWPRAPEHALVVCLDGPHGAETASPHRNATTGIRGYELCLYYPDDPEEQRWVSADGLAALADLARAHVWREYIWRLDDFWPGDQAPHGIPETAA